MDLAGYTGAVDDEIVIRASDDFEVARVQVELTEAGGNAIEAGEATETPAGSGRWVYPATAQVAAG